MFEFAAIGCFLLLPLPLAFRYFVRSTNETTTALKVPFYHKMGSNQQGIVQTTNIRKQPWWLWLVWIFVVTALARPQWVGEPVSVPSSGRDLLLAVDISGSMKTPDMKDNTGELTRLQAVKKVVGDFVIHRKTDRLGLVLFGTQAYLQSPLTYDRQTVNTLLQETEIGFAGDQTSIGDAIGISVKRLRSRPDNQRVLILLTDGANTAGELQPLQAAELAAKEHIKIYTIGFGADEMVVNQGFFGSQVVNPSADLDETTMKAIAEKTNGQYFRARSLEELSDIHNTLNKLEPIESDQEKFRPVEELFYWPLAIAFFISLSWASFTLIQPLFAHKETTPL